MFDLCLFDLDETLVRTEDIREIREAGKNNASDGYRQQIINALNSNPGGRHIYSAAILHEIRARFPLLKLGVFTRSPRSYAITVLKWAYPGFAWDVLVAYEDVERTKPDGQGIDRAMDQFGILDAEYLPRTLLVGDNDVDVKAAYHCGCVIVLDKGAWEERSWDHWRALEHVPDALVDFPRQVIEVLDHPAAFLPELERALDGGARTHPPRFDRIGHFIPRTIGGDKTSYQIYVAGRYFSNYQALQFRRCWHRLTQSIEQNKDSNVFPPEWIETVRSFIAANFLPLTGMPSNLVVSVIPHRPGRIPRLENFLVQLADSFQQRPLPGLTVHCEPMLLAYRAGVQSQHGDHLGRDARFTNVRDNLFVQRQDLVQAGRSYLILDDVVTTGASLIYASLFLRQAGGANIKCLAMAKNVGNIFFNE